MTEAEFLERIDAHLVRVDEHMARGNELMSRVVELHDDQRAFTRDLVRRNEVVLGELAAESRAGRRVLIDLHDEIQAQRGALLTLVDELRRHGLGGSN